MEAKEIKFDVVKTTEMVLHLPGSYTLIECIFSTRSC
jgi:2-polyprenyl-3-methyl-5-hydroxy-6-metoxy-1,4-benzoquinol methylase